MSWECLAFKRIGDDVSGSFADNSGMNRFNGVANFADDMSKYAGDQTAFDANWVSSDSSKMRGDPVGEVIDLQQDQDGSDDHISFDLWAHGILPSDTNWTLRWKWTTTSQDFLSPNNEIITVCLKSNDVGINNGVVGEYIGFWYSANAQNGLMAVQADSVNNLFPVVNRTVFDTLFSTFGGPPWTRYFELKRTSATSAEATIFSDSDYTQIIEKRRVAITTSITDLRYIMVSNEDTTASTGVKQVAELDDVMFFNNTEGVLDSGLKGFVLHGDENLTANETFNPGTATKIITGADDGNWATGAGVSVTGGVVSGWGADAVWRRATYDMQANDGITLSDTNWTIDYEFVATGASANPGHHPFSVYDNTVDPTTSPLVTPIDGVTMRYGINTTNGQKVSLDYANTTGAVNANFSFSTDRTAEPDIPITFNVTYYCRMMRIGGSRFVLELYSDSARTSLHGKRALDNVPTTMTGLTTINSSTSSAGGAGRVLNGTMGNINIYDGVAQEYQGGLVFDEDFSTYSSSVPAGFIDTFDDDTFWTTTDSTRMRVEPDQGFLFCMTVADNSNDAIARDLLSVNINTLTPDKTFDFSSATGWVQEATGYTVETGPEIIQTIVTGNSPNKGLSYDLFGNDSITVGANWALRFKIETVVNGTATGADNATYIGLSDQPASVSESGTQDSISFQWRKPTSDQMIRGAGFYGNNQNMRTNSVGNFIIGPGPNYVELIKIGVSMTLNVYSDSAYTTLIDSKSGLHNGPTGLQYIVLKNRTQAGSPSGSQTNEIDDMEFYNNIPGGVSDTEWLLRFKATIYTPLAGSGADKFLYAGMFELDQDSSANDVQDGIYHIFKLDNAQRDWEVCSSDNVGPRAGSRDIHYDIDDIFVVNEPVVYWCELARVSSDSVRASLYSDPSYSNLVYGGGVVVDSAITPVTNLRYLKFMNDQPASGTGNLDVYIDDVCFWNGRSTACDPVVPTTDFFEDFSSYANQGSADASWVPQITFPSTGYVQVDVGADNLRWDMIRNGTDNRCTFDLGAGFLDSQVWTIRYKLTFNAGNTLSGSSSANAQLLVQDTDVAQSGINNSISYGIIQSPLPDGREMRVISFESGVIDGFASEPNDAIAYTGSQVSYYCEFTRNGLEITGRRYANSDYTGLIEEISDTMSNDPTGLRYLIWSSGDDSTAWNGDEKGSIDDIQIWNGQIPGKAETPITPWVTDDSDRIFIDSCQQNLQYSLIGDNTQHTMFYDLESALDNEKWVMRWTQYLGEVVTINPAGITQYLGIGDNTASATTVQDAITARFSIDSNAGDQRFLTVVADNAIVNTQGPSFTIEPEQNTIYYWEMIRESATKIRLTLFSDPAYTFPLESQTQTITNTIEGLRYVKVMQSAPVSTNSALGNYDDIKIWDGVDVADSFDARRYLQIVASYQNITTGTVQPENRLNLDDSVSYAIRFSENDGADSPFPNQNHWPMNNQIAQAGGNGFFEQIIYNQIDEEKLSIWHSFAGNTPGATVAPARRDEFVGKWTNVITRASRITLAHDLADTGNLDTDTEAVVFGTE